MIDALADETDEICLKELRITPSRHIPPPPPALEPLQLVKRM
jgi:hypothetical protein